MKEPYKVLVVALALLYEREVEVSDWAYAHAIKICQCSPEGGLRHQQDDILLAVLDKVLLVPLAPDFFGLELETYLVPYAQKLDLVA